MININKYFKYKKNIFYFKVLLITLYLTFLIDILENKNKSKTKNNHIDIENYYLNEFKTFDELIFKITLIKYRFSIKYNIVFHNKNKKLLIPSHLSLYYNLHVFCQAFNFENNFFIKNIANIYKNIYYNCVEYINLNNHIKFGISIFKKAKYIEYSSIELFTSNLIDYNNNKFKKNKEFDALKQMKLFKKKKRKKSNKFVKLFYKKPILVIKYHSISKLNKWYFKNIYNNYFCFCVYSLNSSCLFSKIKQECKYNLYLNIIDKNRHLFNKNHYLFSDFSSIDTAPGEAFLVFKEMLKQNLNVHFMSKREDIYSKYNSIDNFIYLKNPTILKEYNINGDFIEKYLDIFLKLKAVISGAKIFSINNLFYYLEYITYICLGHGISYLKDFLYIDYYSSDIFNKIVLPPSNIIISNAKKYGWKDENIIRIGLPRWDNFFKNNRKFQNDETIKKQSIFIMFTWRDLNQNKSISKYYFKNIFNLINNQKLNYILNTKNITLYYSLHHMIERYKLLFNVNKIVKYINQEQIVDCLTKSSLLVTDFSSIIFDIMVRKKPFIIFIPDCEDPNIFQTYNINYYYTINNLKNGTKKFINRFGYSKCMDLVKNGRRCNDYIGETAKMLDEILDEAKIDKNNNGAYRFAQGCTVEIIA